jgi:hypothetical protein
MARTMSTLTLRDLQAAFRRAMQGEPEAALLAEIVENGLATAGRLAIYRHHVVATLTDVLTSTYPVICRLVDPRFFAYAAHDYIREHLPASPCLFEYGTSFPEFLAAFPPCRHLEYLADVARLEWALHAARHADDPPALEPAQLASVPTHETPWLVLQLHPSVAFIGSPWPIDRIWRANQPGSDPEATVDLAAGEARLEIRCQGDDVVFRTLDAPTFAFRRALAEGLPLAGAADRALTLQPDFPLTAAVRNLLDENIVVDFTASREPREVSRCP